MPAPPSAQSSAFRQTLEARAFAMAEFLIPRLPLSIFLGVIRILAPLAWLVDRRGRRTTSANLQVALGPMRPAHCRRLARLAYRAMGRTFFDLLRTPLLTPENWQKYIDYDDFAGLDALAAQGKGMIFVCLHYGSFEWNNILFARLGHPPLVVTQESKNPLITERLSALRASAGSQPITQERSFLRMFKHLKKGQPVGLLADLTLKPTEPSVIIDTFGGLKMCVNILAAELHRRTGAPIVPITCRPQPDGRAKLTIHPVLCTPPQANTQEITQALWNCLEPEIRQHPEHWLWAYKHWRYRPETAAASTYPFYANPSSAFNRLVQKQAAEASRMSEVAPEGRARDFMSDSASS